MLAFMPGQTEWLVILVALLIFGSRLPSVMRSLGRSIKEFRKGLDEVDEDISSAGDAAADRAAGKRSDMPG
jgi:sec-independent protein translocase protein TatA